ncbi:MAG: hypothetical protein ACI9VR_001986 [Cognaticolwellia sp.]|jgi:hypothetical protein
MARLIQCENQRSGSLASRTLIGRGSACTLRIKDGRVSGEHAAISWREAGGWELRDLVSRNGTYVDGERLASGGRLVLKLGMRLQFGGAGLPVWAVEDLSSPQVEARRVHDGALRTDPMVLALPDDEDPQVVILESSSGWILEQGDESRRVFDQDLIDVGGEAWRLALPVDIGRTVEATHTHTHIANYGLDFRVSLDQEYVELKVHTEVGSSDLKPRSHHYLLLVLARLRLEGAEHSEGERGWIYASELARQLRMDRRTVNVHIHRARKEMAALGLPIHIVDRRPSTNQLRIGTARLKVEAI